MERTPAPVIPSASAAWSQVAARYPGPEPAEAPAAAHAAVLPQGRRDDAAQLRTRLLEMIVANEKTHKAATAQRRRPR